MLEAGTKRLGAKSVKSRRGGKQKNHALCASICFFFQEPAESFSSLGMRGRRIALSAAAVATASFGLPAAASFTPSGFRQALPQALPQALLHLTPSARTLGRHSPRAARPRWCAVWISRRSSASMSSACLPPAATADGAGVAPDAPDRMRPVAIDTDAGVDDAIAMLISLRRDAAVQPVAVISVAGVCA